MVLGKFLPPHSGHVYLVEFAQQYVDELTVVVASLESDPIDGEQRFAWVKELFPDAKVVHLTDENPREPSEHPNFWDIWRDSLLRVLPDGVDLVFASEDYGAKLAEVLEARFVPVDPARAAVPVSGTAIRTDPVAQWQYIPRCVRPHFAKRICVFGPESTGKTTLTSRLADHYDTVVVPEYARAVIAARDGDLVPEDIEAIARGQMASEDAIARNANRLLICDTDVLTTTIWSDVLFDNCPQWIRDAADARHYDLYLLLEADVPWVDDEASFLPEDRRGFFDRCKQALDERARPYVTLKGGWSRRFEAAVRAIDDILEPFGDAA